ncbi:hypothetical protein PISMIDRAFT_58067, partial [Pisolithus microcarpus 441]
IRQSELQGIKIPNMTEPIKVTLFADDTLVYTTEKDNLQTLDLILDDFCTASTAKFNQDKTEILPIGAPDFRQKLIMTRKINSYTFTEGKTIITDRQPMRTLGAWIGNNIKIDDQWDKILEKQKQKIKLWMPSCPTLRGKELLSKSLIQSRALYLATINNVPQSVEIEMSNLIKSFLWNNKKHGSID